VLFHWWSIASMSTAWSNVSLALLHSKNDKARQVDFAYLREKPK
jgi:hypothetical protein